MSLQYPPYIEGKLPAQYGDVLRIPFQLNRATGANEVEDGLLHARVKTISTNRIIKDGIMATAIIKQANGLYLAEFPRTWKNGDKTEELELQIGQFYKIQIGWVESSFTYFSTIGTFKYTIKPEVLIKGLNVSGVDQGRDIYIGTYTNLSVEDKNGKQVKDTSEKVYEYRFDLYQGDTLLETSGRLLHNSSQDAIDSSEDSYSFRTDLLDNNYYQVVYTVYTNNDLIISSPTYYIRKPIEYPVNHEFSVNAENFYDDGYVKISIQSIASEINIAGDFKLCRANSLEDYKYWDELGSFTMDVFMHQDENKFEFDDNTVQQGVSYKYAFYQYTDTGLATQKIISNTVTAEFEDTFLSDGERQLKVRFNPKVSSFKNTILEQKMDTLGGKYPFVFRNGNTNYKEIPISGLISLLMDENHFFYQGFNKNEDVRTATGNNEEDLSIIDRQTNLTGPNFTNERLFKLEVLEWLTNGQPKLFRSPAEGNYIVRLMNTSLAPNDTLGRMLHTFTSTGYEFAECNFNNLKSFGFVANIPNRIETIHYQTIDLVDYQEPTGIALEKAVFARITEANEGAVFTFHLENTTNPISISIGRTGTYIFPVDINNPIIQIDFDPKNRGLIELGYIGLPEYNIISKATNSEDDTLGRKLTGMNYIEKCAQYIGKDENIITQMLATSSEADGKTIKKNELNNIIMLRIQTTDEVDLLTSTESQYTYTITYKDADAMTFTMRTNTLGNNIIPNVPLEAYGKGFIEYRLHPNTFSYFAPQEIILGPGLIADVFYSIIEYTYE